jgi:hypothetical protein
MALPLLTLEFRLDRLRRRRRANFIKQWMTAIPLVVGSSLLLLVAFAGMASAR